MPPRNVGHQAPAYKPTSGFSHQTELTALFPAMHLLLTHTTGTLGGSCQSPKIYSSSMRRRAVFIGVLFSTLGLARRGSDGRGLAAPVASVCNLSNSAHPREPAGTASTVRLC